MINLFQISDYVEWWEGMGVGGAPVRSIKFTGCINHIGQQHPSMSEIPPGFVKVYVTAVSDVAQQQLVGQDWVVHSSELKLAT